MFTYPVFITPGRYIFKNKRKENNNRNQDDDDDDDDRGSEHRRDNSVLDKK